MIAFFLIFTVQSVTQLKLLIPINNEQNNVSFWNKVPYNSGWYGVV